MYELHGVGLTHALTKLGRFQAASAAAAGSTSGGLISKELRHTLIQHMEEMLAATKDIDAPVTRAGCDTLLAAAKGQSSITYEALRQATEEIQSRLYTEVQSVIFLGIEPRMAGYYAPPEPLFGGDVALRFPSVAYEVEEAGKCLALDRSTACAFHSIRCLEAGESGPWQDVLQSQTQLARLIAVGRNFSGRSERKLISAGPQSYREAAGTLNCSTMPTRH